MNNIFHLTFLARPWLQSFLISGTEGRSCATNPDYLFGYQETRSSYHKLLESWQVEIARQGHHYMDDTAPYFIGTLGEDLLVSRSSVSLPMTTVRKRDIVEFQDAYDYLLREMQNDSSTLIIFCLDGLFRRARRGWVFNERTMEFVQGEHGWEIQYSNDIHAYLPEVIDLGNQSGDTREQELPYTRLRLNMALITQCVESLSQGKFRCFANAEPYIVLQLIHYQHHVLDLGFVRMEAKDSDAASYPKLFLPNLFLRARDCHELVSFASTVQQDYRRSIGWTVIEGKNKLKVCLIKIVDEMIYAFSDDGHGERFFIRKMTELSGQGFRAVGVETAISKMILAETFLSKSECNLSMINRLQPGLVGGL